MSQNKQSGLDIDLGNQCSKTAFEWAKKTYPNRSQRKGQAAQGLDSSFSNLLVFGNERIGIASDGIGTKIELAERAGIYHTLGFDLVAMVADDLATAGFEPSNISNIIDVNYLDHQLIDDLMRGLHNACNFAKISISGGEIAELGNRIGGYGEGPNFNWCSTAIGVLPEQLERPIDASKVKEGDLVIALQSHGFRSNGFSLIRKIMQNTFGDLWHNEKYDVNKTWGEILLTPSLIYAPLISQLIQNDLTPNGIAHITGGGIFDNLSRILKKQKLGAVLNDLFPPHPFIKKLQELGNVSNEAAYLYWNMGNGMLLIIDKDKQEAVINYIKTTQYKATLAGVITKDQHINIQTKFLNLTQNY